MASAVRLARDPRCAGAADTLNLRIDAAPWGVGFCEFDSDTYQPSETGDAAFIVAAEAGGELVDLVACRLKARAMASRLGLAAVLGEDWIASARWHGVSLPLFADVLAWASAGFVGAVVVDWRGAYTVLADVPAISCASLALARRLHGALAVPTVLPAISYARHAHGL